MTRYDYHVTMKAVRIADLKARLSEHLRGVRKGHELTVYDRDEPIARIVPWSRRGALSVREPVKAYRSLGEVPLPKPVHLDIDAVDLLLEDRDSGR